MAKGDHLVVSYGTYTHHGIDIGDGTVVVLSKERGSVVRISRAEFRDGRAVKVRKYDRCDPPRIVVRRALGQLGATGYNLLWNNCEHFATWCKRGRAQSAQVQTYKRRLAATGTKAPIKTTARVLAKSSSKTAIRTLARSATPALLVADAAQLVVEVAATNLGTDPQKAQCAGRSGGPGEQRRHRNCGGRPDGRTCRIGALGLWRSRRVFGFELSPARVGARRYRGLATAI
jgi:hypothetical protein